jgi:hypothetical protein
LTNLGILNQQLVIVVVTISGILSSLALLPSQLYEIYADDSETNTEQGLSQENIGSGDSTNVNCGQNSISGSALTVCKNSLFRNTRPDSGILEIKKIVNCPRGFEEICPMSEDFGMILRINTEEGQFFVLVPGSRSGMTIAIPASTLPVDYTIEEIREPPIPAGLALDSEKSGSCDGILQPGERVICIVKNIFTVVSPPTTD